MYDPNRPQPPAGMMQIMGDANPVYGGANQAIPGVPGGGMGQRGSWMSNLFGEDFNRQGFIDQIRAWASSRPSDPAGLDAWKAQMPSPFSMGQPAAPNPAAMPTPVTQIPSYPVQQLPSQIAPVPMPQQPANGIAVGEPNPAAVSGPAQGFPAKPQQAFGAPRPPSQWPSRPSRPAMPSGGGFFGSRKGRY